MKRGLSNFLIRSKKSSKFFLNNIRFKREFKRQLRLLIVVTLGFTIAFTWRQTIFDIFMKVIQFFTTTQNRAILSALTSLLITIISLLLIYLTSYLLKDSYDNY